MTETQTEPSVSKIGMKMPIFSPLNVRLYFAQLEANFSIANISNEETKYSHLIASIDAQHLTYVSDIVYSPLPPPKENPYAVLKEKLIEQFEHSETKKINTLLQDLTLGDKKPSQLLHDMKELSNHKLDESFLKNLWLGHLPSNMQAILATSSESLSQLALMADKIAEVVNPPSIASIAPPQTDNVRLSHLEKQVEDLKSQIQKLLNHRPRSRIRNFSKSRSVCKNSRRVENSDNVCWYKTFADKATKCKSPCKHDSKNVQACQ